MERTFIGRGVGMLFAGALLLAACGGQQPASGVADAAGPAEPPVASSEVPAAADEEQAPSDDGAAAADEAAATREGAATLAPLGTSVSGEAALRWDPDTTILTVTVVLEGLEPGTRYTGQITPGCGMGTGHIHKLKDLVGGPDGSAEETTEISGVEGVELDGGWSAKVGRPPAGGAQGGSPGGGPKGGAGPQACGEVGPTP